MDDLDTTLGWRLTAEGGLALLTDEGVREFAKNDDGLGWTEFIESGDDDAVPVVDSTLLIRLDAIFKELQKENN
jgi:hypothetical protein